MIGKTELARIHILKKEAVLADDDYHSLLSGAAGVTSAADIDTPDQYYRVVFALEKYILSIGKVPSGRQERTKKAFPEAVAERAKHVLGPAYRNRLAGYLKKMGKADLGDCSDRELRRVMGFLSTVERNATR
jgi:hypothetical protein